MTIFYTLTIIHMRKPKQTNSIFIVSCFGRVFPEKNSRDNKTAKYWSKATVCLDKQNSG